MTTLNRRHVLGSGLALTAFLPGTALAKLRQSSAPFWSEHSSLPMAVQEIYPAALNGRVYVAGGIFEQPGIRELGLTDRAFSWQPETGSWQELAPLPEARHHPNLVAHDGAIYAIGGFREHDGGRWHMIANTTRYDVAADRWEEVAPMPAPYGETVAASLTGGIHVATGRQPTGQANANWQDHGDVGHHYVYDSDADRWREAPPNSKYRNSAAGAVLNDRLHVIGGRRVFGENHTDHEAFDPDTGRWTALAPLPQGQGGLAAAVLDGQIYAFGGEFFEKGGGVYAECWVYDSAADSWSEGPDMLTPRHGLGAVSLGDHILSIGGAIRAGGNGTSSLVEVLRRTT